MGYKKIPNLYRPASSQAVIGREAVWAMEKIHGTSAHVGFSIAEGLRLFAGGIKHVTFEQMIDARIGLDVIDHNFRHYMENNVDEVIVYGEAYGGKCQAMSNTYGDLNFVAFEVKVDGKWLTVPKAEKWARKLGFDFVHYEKGPATVEWLDAQRDAQSVQAVKNGCGEGKVREGIVVRTLDDEVDRFGERIIAKHKCDKFSETRTPREIDPEQQKVWSDARETAEEWVTEMRLEHVLDKMIANKWLEHPLEPRNTPKVIGEMIKDVRIESGVGGSDPEIEWSKPIQKAVGSRTARVFKDWLKKNICLICHYPNGTHESECPDK